MPKALAKACGVYGCGLDQPCPVHGRKPWDSTSGKPKRITGRRLQRLRAQLFDREPLCVVCRAKGFITVAVIRDHIVPLAEGGTDTDDNTQPLCQACSDEKTAAEAKRGAQRARR